MSSLRQIQANRQNAQQSTGPRTVAGRLRSRANALKHGLAGQGVVLPADQHQAIAARIAEWTDELRPDGSYQVWLVGVMATEAVRFDCAQEEENALQLWLAERASACWEIDRQLEAEEKATRLSRRPGWTVALLRQNAQGAAWLIGLWKALGRSLAQPGGWTDIERTIALDLLGVPRELRQGKTQVDPAEGESPEAVAHAIVQAQLSALETLKAEALDRLDAFERSAAEQGLPVRPDRGLTLLRRYQAACFRRLQWASRQLQTHQRPGAIIESPAPQPAAQPAPETEPEPEPEPVPEPLETPASMAAATLDLDPAPSGVSYLPISITPLPTSSPLSSLATPRGDRRHRRARRKRSRR